MQRFNIAQGEYYHLFNRGVNKENIFLDKKDYVRFLFLILFNQSPKTFSNLGDYVSKYLRHRVFKVSRKNTEEVCSNRLVELVSFCLMPNHFHLLILEKVEGGITQYMQRCLNAYTKYFNTKYKKSGHLFQGPYKAVHVETNSQLLHLSAYIHRNPIDIREWSRKIEKYPWSSLSDYLEENRWEKLLKREIIADQFKNKKDYGIFIKESPAKKPEGHSLLIDEE